MAEIEKKKRATRHELMIKRIKEGSKNHPLNSEQKAILATMGMQIPQWILDSDSAYDEEEGAVISRDFRRFQIMQVAWEAACYAVINVAIRNPLMQEAVVSITKKNPDSGQVVLWQTKELYIPARTLVVVFLSHVIYVRWLRKYWPNWFLRGANTVDVERIKNTLDAMSTSGRSRYSLLREAYKVARGVVYGPRAILHPFITNVSDALLEKGTLTGAEVLEICAELPGLVANSPDWEKYLFSACNEQNPADLPTELTMPSIPPDDVGESGANPGA